MASAPLQAALAWLENRIHQGTDIGPALFERLLKAEREQGLLHENRPLCPFLRPHILTRSQYDEICRAATTLAFAFERLVSAAFTHDQVLHELGLTAAEYEMARIDPGYPRLCVTSRLDSFNTATGFSFIEYNAETPAGIPDQALMEEIFYHLPHMQEFLGRFPHWIPHPEPKLLETMLETYRAWGGTRDYPHIAIVDWKGVATESEFEVLRNYFSSKGSPTIIADPHELEYDGSRLRAGDFEIDIFYKRVIIHEFLAKFDANHPLVQAYADHNVCMINSFRSKMAHKKAGFAILSDPLYADIFTPHQQEVIARHIPWTRRVKNCVTSHHNAQVDLPEFIRTQQQQLVLKPNDEYGGHGVVLGWETSAADWDAALDHALKHDYVVQERVPTQKITMPMFTNQLEHHELWVDFNPFLFNNQVEGAMVRLSASALVNISAGGGETALLILENC
ncbi:MAG: hypothetical protein K1Y36_16135 [Blastocatellia bacterium]|nr:hypothetical protein [Blastocatellia bacterium]